MKLGDTIVQLRKRKGITQEQLANMVGVSPPAVSKWETNTSCPDITLLAPIARALGTDIDTLLDFTPKLTDQESSSFAAEVAALSKDVGSAAALARMQEIMRTYPGNPMLTLQMAAVIAYLPSTTDDEKMTYRQQAKGMLEDVLDSNNALLSPSAAYLLSDLCLEDDELDRAEALIENIPDTSYPDKVLLKATLYERRGNQQRAKKTIQTALYLAFLKIENYLAKLISFYDDSDLDAALHLCTVHQQIAVLMDYPYIMSELLFAEVYLRAGKEANAVDNLLQLAQSLCEKRKNWGSKLFSEMERNTEQTDDNLKLLRQVVYDTIQKEENFESLSENGKYKKAIELLQK